MRYEFVNGKEVIREIAKNASNHFEQRIENYANNELNIDWSHLINMTSQGNVVVALIRGDNGILAYSVYEVSTEIFHKAHLIANNIVIYVDDSLRGKGTKYLMSYADEQLSSLGINEVNYTFSNKAISPFLKQSGFKPKYTIWSKLYV